MSSAQSRRIVALLAVSTLMWLAPSLLQGGIAQTSGAKVGPADASAGANADLMEALGIHFVDGSSSSLVIERNGKKYAVDIRDRTVREAGSPGAKPADNLASSMPASPAAAKMGPRIFLQKCAVCHGEDGKGRASVGTPDLTDPNVQAQIADGTLVNIIKHGKRGTAMPAWEGKLSANDIGSVASFVRSLGSGNPEQVRAAAAEIQKNSKIYTPADDYLYSLPTGRRLERHGFYVNFTHRFVFDPAFTGPARGAALLGLDGFSVSSFGFRYGLTDKLSLSVYRSPSVIGRPIELMAAYHLLDEHDGRPLNAAFRLSVDGQNNFSENFTTNFEGIFSRSLFKRAQIYFVPTFSVQNRRLTLEPYLNIPAPHLPGINSFSLGAGAALDIRPTVALIGEVIPTLVNGPELGIHRPAFAFAIQKRLWRHAFTLGFSNSPGTVVSQRAGTRATFLNDPSADTPAGLFIGFDLMRQIY